MRTLGIDQSYKSCALVLMDGGGDVDYFNVIRREESYDVFDNSFMIAEAIGDTIRKTEPDLVILEGLSFGGKGNQTRDLAGLQFVIITNTRWRWMYKNIILCAPPTLKKFATGNGRADKEAMIEKLPTEVAEIFKKAGYKKTTGLSDLSDAYWLAKYGLTKLAANK